MPTTENRGAASPITLCNRPPARHIQGHPQNPQPSYVNKSILSGKCDSTGMTLPTPTNWSERQKYIRISSPASLADLQPLSGKNTVTAQDQEVYDLRYNELIARYEKTKKKVMREREGREIKARTADGLSACVREGDCGVRTTLRFFRGRAHVFQKSLALHDS